MKLKLLNKCSKNIIVRINEFEYITMSSKDFKEIVLPETNKIVVAVRKEEDSFFEKNFFRKKYKLTVKTDYTLEQENKEMNLTFIIESVRVSGDVYYEKVIIKENPQICIGESNSLCNTERMRNLYNRKFLINQLFISPFEHLTFLCILVIVLTLVFAVKIGAAFSILFFIISYAMILLMNIVVGKCSDLFFHKLWKVESDKKEFLNMLSPQFLNHFYNNGCSYAYNGEVYVDEV